MNKGYCFIVYTNWIIYTQRKTETLQQQQKKVHLDKVVTTEDDWQLGKHSKRIKSRKLQEVINAI